MVNNTLNRIDAQIAFHEEELRKLRAAREVIVHLEKDDDAVEDEGSAPEQFRLTDSIERILFERGPTGAAALFAEIGGRGFEATRNTVYTTLSRMKKRDRLTSNGGMWDLTARTRRAMNKI